MLQMKKLFDFLSSFNTFFCIDSSPKMEILIIKLQKGIKMAKKQYSLNERLTRIGNNRITRFGNIQTRLTLFFILLLVFSIATIGLLTYSQSSQAIHAKAELYSEQVMNQIGQNLSMDLQHIENVMDDISSSEEIQNGLDGYLSAAPEQQYAIDNKIHRLFSHKLSLMKYVTSASIAIDQERRIGSSANYLNQDQYLQLIKDTQGDSTVRYSLIDYASGETQISIRKSFKSAVSGKVLGTLILTIKEGHLSDLYRTVDLGNKAGIFVIDKSGVIISSIDSKSLPIREKLPDTHIIKQVTQGELNTFSSNFQSVSSLLTFSPIKKTDWLIVSAIPDSFLQTEMNQLAVSTFWIGLICLLISAVAAFLISLGISVPSKRIVNLMDKAKLGDFSLLLEDNYKDEIGTISNNYDEMIRNIRGLLMQVDSTSKKMVEQSRTVDEVADQTRQAAAHYAAISQQIAEGASDQAVESGEGVKHMNNLSSKINVASQDIETVSTAVMNTKWISENALSVMHQLNEKANTANSAMQNVIADFEELNEYMKQVTSIVGVIKAIAQQTNVLSINATIEAARAGHMGKGFAVVANEVKQLAEQSRAASESIGDIIKSVNSKTMVTSQMAGRAGNILADQQQAVLETNRTFQTINQDMEAISGYLSNVNDSVQEIVSAKERTLGAIQVISSVAENTAATLEEAYSSTEEQSANAEELSKLAKQLDGTAQELSAAIARFKME